MKLYFSSGTFGKRRTQLVCCPFQELEARRDAEVGADEANESDRVQELSLQAEQVNAG